MVPLNSSRSGVGEAGFDLHRPGGGIDHATDSLYASLPSVERAVIQLGKLPAFGKSSCLWNRIVS